MAATPKMYLSGGATNAVPSASLGGVKSSVEVSVSKLNNLFDDTTGDEASAGRIEWRCVYIENIGADDWVDPVVWVTAQPHDPNPPYTLSGEGIDIGLPAAKGQVTAIGDDHTTAPAGIAFTRPATKGAGLALPTPDYATNDYVALWVRRTVPSSQAYSTGTDFSLAVEGDQA
jgi:hypothetical protein